MNDSRVKIRDYRGFEIFFDTDKDQEVFYCMSNSRDTETTKKSFSAIKKWIDDYIKANTEFKPTRVEYVGSGMFNKSKEVILIGIRKDGLFVYNDENGKKQTISKFDENDWVVYNPDNIPLREGIAKLQEEKEIIYKKIVALEKKITGIPISELKKDMNPE